jgi:hypothetical protein
MSEFHFTASSANRISTMHSTLLSCLAGFLITTCVGAQAGEFIDLDPDWLVSTQEAYQWVSVKNENLPTFTGSPEWLNYMAFLEKKLSEYGAVDFFRNSWEFERWDTSDDDSNWSLTSDGNPVRVAHYGAYSGSSGPDGITAELIYYDHDNPPASIEGKIVVIPTRPHPEPPFDQNYLVNYTFNDYEYATDPENLAPPFEVVDPSFSFTFDIWWQLAQRLERIPQQGGAAGAIIVYDMAYERTRGIYTFPVPALYDSPTLVLSREDGARVIADAKAGKTATLRLEATLESAQAYQLIAYLPGRDYGTDKDEQIVLVNHTDGPSISQDNGALGLLAIIKYFSNIPQGERPRTLTIYLDCRHYMPGMEIVFSQVSWLNRFPEAKDRIVGMVQAEHLGEMDFREVDGRVEAVGLPEQSYLWTRNNPILIDAAIVAVKKHGWTRVQVAVPERPGIKGGIQQVWWGVGALGTRGGPVDEEPLRRCAVWHCLDVPGFGLGGFLGHYWTVDADISRWSQALFVSQATTMTELTGVLMTADLEDIKPE